MIIGDGIIPEAQSVYDVEFAIGRDDVVLLPHMASLLKQTIPAGSTLYNLEPLFDGCRSLSVGYMQVLRQFPVWDYQRRNVEYLLKHGVLAQHVPYGYTPQLERVKEAEKKIEVLFFGSFSRRRAQILQEIDGVTVATGCYGRNLDLLIAQAKVVVNIHYCDEPHPLEVVRLNYLMANGCCVVSEPGWDDEDNERYAPGVAMTSDVAAKCQELRAGGWVDAGEIAKQTIRSMPMVVPQ